MLEFVLPDMDGDVDGIEFLGFDYLTRHLLRPDDVGKRAWREVAWYSEAYRQRPSGLRSMPSDEVRDALQHELDLVGSVAFVVTVSCVCSEAIPGCHVLLIGS
jgi:hypothetical protein